MSDDEQLRERIAADMPRDDRGARATGAHPLDGLPGLRPRQRPRLRRGDEGRSSRRPASRTHASSSWTADIPRSSASSPDPSGAPTVLLYAHHDVQPEGPLDEWDTPPFEPVVKDGRMYGRGAADDKSGIVVHAAAIRALLADGDPPVTIKVVVEGEEECSTAHLPELVQGNADLLRADVAVIADGGQLPHRRPHVELLDPRRDRHRRAGPGPAARPALRLVRRADPGRDHRALTDDRARSTTTTGPSRSKGSSGSRGTGMQIPEDEFRRGVGRPRLRWS